MGVCCSQIDNSKTRSGIYHKKETDPLTLNQCTNLALDAQNLASKKQILPITLDQVNKSIDEWKELTKRRRLKPTEKLNEEKNPFYEAEGDIKNCLNELNRDVIDIEGRKDKILNINLNTSNETLGIDNEINQDFLNMNKKFNRGFSDISSTIHFTALNSKDLASSKLKFHHQLHNGNSVKSQSIVNVLDELNNNYFNHFTSKQKDSNSNLVNLNMIHRNIEKNKIYIQNNAFNLNAKNEVKEISMSILEKSKITIKKKDLNFNTTSNYSYINNFNNVQINSYVIVNRTHDNQFNTIEEDTSKIDCNNEATIHSHTEKTNQEFLQENIFYHVDKLDKFYLSDKSELNIILKKNPSKEILKFGQTSLVNGVNLPIWENEYERLRHYQKNSITQNQILLEEIDNIQIEWKRISNNFKSFLNKSKNIIQGTANNCSVIAALIAINNYDTKFGKCLLNSIVHPQSIDGNIISNINGYYGLKLFFNGCPRYMEVDDYIPYNKITQQEIFSSTPNLYDLSIKLKLIEKAIFTLYNGNNNYSNLDPSIPKISFSIRSNPSYEIYHLTGWIPEIVMFEDISNKSNLWQRLYSNFTDGNIMVCLGTGTFIDGVKIHDNMISSSTNLIQEHSYSVIDVLEVSDKKLMKCKNPWGSTTPSIAYDIRTIISKLKNEKEEIENLKDEENGYFWIEWQDVLEYFLNIFLAWNPEIYPCKYSIVSSWRNSKSSSKFYDENFSLENNPQYLITIPEHSEDFEVRILLTKHVNHLENYNKNRKKISFKLFMYEGYPVVYPIDHLRALQNPSREINSDVFIFEASTQLEQYVLVILKNEEKDDEESEVFFSLDVFSFVELDVRQIPKREIIENKTIKYTDIWNSNKSGGNLTSQNFVNNPQYKLTIPQISHLQIKLETAIPTPIMLSIIDSGKNVSKIPYDLVINNKNPGFFFNSFSYFECVLDPGEYNIVCVSQEDKTIGRYCLEINTIKNSKLINNFQFSDLKIEKLSTSNFNFVEIFRGEWDKNNSKSINEKNPYATLQNPGFVFYVPNTPNMSTMVKFVLRSNSKLKINGQTGIADYPSVTIVLYKIESDENFMMIYNGANFNSSAWGFFSDDIDLEYNNYGYVVACINQNKNQFSKFELEIHSSQRLKNTSTSNLILHKNNNFNIYSKWDKLSSGGSLNDITFFKNPKYELSIIKQTEAYIKLVSNENFYISFLLFETEINSELNDYTEIENEIIESSFSQIDCAINYMQEVYLKKVNFKTNKKYVLIPYTKMANQVGYFDLTISSDEEIIVKELQHKICLYQNIYYICNNIFIGIKQNLHNKIKSEKNLSNNNLFKNYHIQNCGYFKSSSVKNIFLRVKSTNGKGSAKLGICVYAIIDNSPKESFVLIARTKNLYNIPFGVSLKENYKDYLVFIISDTEQNGSSYEILVETATNTKMIEFSQLDNNLLNYLFSF